MSTALVPLNSDEAQLVALEALEGDVADSTESSFGVAYLGLRTNSTGKNTPELKALLDDAGVEPYDFFVKDSISARRVGRADFHLVTVDRAWTKQNNRSQVIAAVLSDKDIPASDSNFREHILGVALVVVGESLVPALFNFRSGMVGAVRAGVRALEEAKNPAQWAARGAQYKLSAYQAQLPARFLVTAWAKEEEPKSGGDPYTKGDSSIRPSGTTDIERYSRATADPKTLATLGQALNIHRRRVNEIKEKPKK